MKENGLRESLEQENARLKERIRELETRSPLEDGQGLPRLATLLSNLPGMVYRCVNDTQWTMDYASKGAKALTGYDPAELEGNRLIAYGELIHPKDREMVWKTVQASITGRKPFALQYRIKDREGREKWVWEQGRGVYNSKGGLEALEGYLTDINDLKGLEKDLAASRDFYLTLFDQFPTPIWRSGLDGLCNYFNRAWLDFTGRPLEKELGQGWAEGVHPDDLEHCLGTYIEHFNRRAPFEMQYRLRHRDGSHHWLLDIGRPFLDIHGSFAGYIGTCLDISANREAEEEIRSQKELLETILKSAPIMLDLIGPDGTLQWVNRRWEETIGWSLEEAREVDLFTQCYPDPEERRKVLDFIERGGGEWGEFKLRTRSGEVLDTVWTNVALSNGAHLGLGQDITERVRAEKERRSLEAQFMQSQRLESLGRLAGGVAHDFNNLLAVIIGYTELLLEETPPYRDDREALEQIHDAALRARDVAGQLLAFGRKQVLQVRNVDVNQVVRGFEKMLRRLIGEDIQVITHLGGDLGTIQADPAMLEQILLNLAVNARDAMPDGGEITIETGQAVLDEEYTRTKPEVEPGRYLLLAFSDTGHGMDHDILEKIFEPFFTTKAKGAGSGLGLATVYGIIKQHGGSIWVYSEPQEGTTFKIYFPLAQAEEEADAPAPARRQTAQGGETILVVEDDGTLRDMITISLRRMGYGVISSGDPLQTLELAAAHKGPIHLMLTDVVMPQMNGRVLYESLVKVRPEMRVLFMSGYTENVIAHRGVLDQGINFLQKPFSINTLSQKIREVLTK